VANRGANFVVAISFLTLLNTISNAGTFFLLGFLSLGAVAYFWKRVPETEGLTLEEIEGEMAGSSHEVSSTELRKGASK
jgi:hypothetical protein